MYRKRKKQKTKGEFTFSPQDMMRQEEMELEAPKVLALEEPEDFFIEEFSEDVLLHWKAPEFEVFERDRKWYMYIIIILALIVAYAIFTNGLIMAITFILIGVVGYIYINKPPRILNFFITKDGVAAGKEIFDFDNLKSFWIFYEPDPPRLAEASARRREAGGIRVISLHTKSLLSPYVHIPIHDQNPVAIREILLKYIPEEKHEPGMVETVDRLLKL